MLNRKADFEQLNVPSSAAEELLYLDHAGSPLAPACVVKAAMLEICSTVFMNPHSTANPTTSRSIDRLRERVLKMLGTTGEEYSVIFTMNATHSLSIISDSLQPTDQCFYLDSNHTSVIGMCEGLSSKRKKCVTSEEVEQLLFPPLDHSLVGDTDNLPSILCYPLQSNFSGQRFPKDWVNEFQNSGRDRLVLLDASSYLASSSFNLFENPADFLVLSFYKIFGFPTGVGALIVKNSSARFLSKRFIGGGTVDAISLNPLYYSWKSSLSDRFENGTLPFQQITSLHHSFDYFEKSIGGFDVLSLHCSTIKGEFLSMMTSLKHYNGNPILTFYQADESGGPIIAFNMRDSRNNFIGYNEFMRLASLEGIFLRQGRHCNPGDAQRFLGITSDEVRLFKEKFGHVCGDSNDILNGKPTGCLRISFGLTNTWEDVKKLENFLRHYFVEGPPPASLVVSEPAGSSLTLEEIYIYPIKSCQGFRVHRSWVMQESGLLYDRTFMLVDSSNLPITQKTVKALNLISIESVDVKSGILTVSAPGMKTKLQISLPRTSASDTRISDNYGGACCNKEFQGMAVGSSANGWFSCFLGIPCKLIACAISQSYSNTSPYLLITKESLHALVSSLPDSENHVGALSFRPNFVISSKAPAFEELEWVGKHINLEGNFFDVSDHCERCPVINIDMEGGQHKEPLRTLARSRLKGRIVFGLHLKLLKKKDG